MKKSVKIVLILVALVCFGVALYYPISQYVQEKQNLETMDQLTALRNAGLQAAGSATEAPQTQEPVGENPGAELVTGEPSAEATTANQPAAEPTAEPDTSVEPGATADVASGTPAPTQAPTETPSPSPTPDRRVNTGILSWPEIEKVPLDESRILPQYRELYAMNNDMVGWMTIPGTYVDYPVLQTEQNDYYLTHDFFKNDNENGQLILDYKCDNYTPSYHLVVSGHNRWNKQMFSNVSDYQNKWYWQEHKFIQFDSLMEERTYVVMAAFFSADYDVDEEGFRYNCDIQYKIDAEQWLAEVRAYQLYDTGIDAEFGDQFLTLTTCNSTRRKNGRFVVVCRRVREGEVIE